MVTPPLGAALRAGLSAASREAWMIPVAAVVSLLRTIALLPALAVAWALALEGLVAGARAAPLSWTAPLEGALAVLTSGRYLALVASLAIAGTTLAALLRVVFLSGALPTLGARLSGDPSPRAFARGIAAGFPRQLATALLGSVAELAALGYLVVAVTAALLVAGRLPLARSPLPIALAGGAALTVGVGGIVVARLLADLAAARSAVLAERPAAAFAGAVRRLLDRPGGLLIGAMAFALAATAVGLLVDPVAATLARSAERVGPAILFGPRMMLALLSTFVGAAVELGWLATASVLACAVAPGARPGSGR
jgi:hypothetical protein